jgi:phenylpropionate dioxygenase-like ring-hydroxylating dioxygenase large terminal subunit
MVGALDAVHIVDPDREHVGVAGSPASDAAPQDHHFVDKRRYLAPAFLERERERLWPRVWQLAGTMADLPEPGRYFTYEIADQSVLVVRDGDAVRAFHNACRHRGRALRDPGAGALLSIVCPYHRWEWGLDGCMRKLPCREAFPMVTDAARPGLVPLACEVWGGLVWVHFGDEPAPLAEFLGSMGTRLAAYRLEDYVLQQDQTAAIDCNWKVAVDASNESYHIPAVHPELLQIYDEQHVYALEMEGDHGLGCARFATPSSGRADRDHLTDWMRELVVDAGLEPRDFVGRATEVRAAIQAALRARTEAYDFTALTDDQLTDYCSYFFFPNVHFNIQGLNLNVSRARPHPSDPGKMLLDQWVFRRLPRGAARPKRPVHESFQHGAGSLGPVTDQDTNNYVRVQRGMRSVSFERLIVGELELRIRHMHGVLDRYLARE